MTARETKATPEVVDITDWCFGVRDTRADGAVRPVFLAIPDAPDELHLPVARTPEELAKIFELAHVHYRYELKRITDANDFVCSLPDGVVVVYDVRVDPDGMTRWRQIRFVADA